MSESNKSSEVNRLKQVVWANMTLLKLQTIQYDKEFELSIDYRNGYPRFSILEKIEDRMQTKVTLSTIPLYIKLLSEMILEAVDAVEDYSNSITFRNHKFINGERTDDIIPTGYARVTKDKSGFYLYIEIVNDGTDRRLESFSLEKGNNLVLKFPLSMNNKYASVKKGGDKLHAKAYAGMISELNSIYVSLYLDKHINNLENIPF